MLYRLPESERVCSGICTGGKQKIPISLGNQDFTTFAFLQSGATRNRNLTISG